MAEQKKSGTAEEKKGVKLDQSLSDAPVIFADVVHGFSATKEVARFNLIQHVLVSPTETEVEQTHSKVVARVVMPLSAIPKMHTWLTGILEALSKEGVMRTVERNPGSSRKQ